MLMWSSTCIYAIYGLIVLCRFLWVFSGRYECGLVWACCGVKYGDKVGFVPPPLKRQCATGPPPLAALVAGGLIYLAQGQAPETPPRVRPVRARVPPPTMENGESSSENRKRTVNLKVRCLPEEADEIKDKAIDAGVSVSEFLRCAALKRKTRSTIDSQIINELRRLGGLQKHLFTEAGGHEGGSYLSKEYADILVAIKEAIQRIEG